MAHESVEEIMTEENCGFGCKLKHFFYKLFHPKEGKATEEVVEEAPAEEAAAEEEAAW